MSILDNQHRILIPKDLLDIVSIPLDINVSINYDFDTNSLYLDLFNLSSAISCVGLRKIDSKGRIIMSKNLLELIDANYTSKLIVYVRYERIHISKLQEKTGA